MEYNNVHDGLKKQLLLAVDGIYLRSLRQPHIGFRNQTVRQLLQHLMGSYGQITAIDLGRNNDNMKRPWDPNTPFEHVIAQIDDAVEYAEDGNDTITARQIVNKAYALVYNTGMFFEDCETWDERDAAEKTWPAFKTFFSPGHNESQSTTTNRATSRFSWSQCNPRSASRPRT